MIHDVSNDEWNSKVYDAILIILTHYSNNGAIRELAEYFSDLYSNKDLSDLSAQSKAYHSYFYKCFHNILDTPRF